VEVYLEGTILGSTSNPDGTFEIKAIPAGNYTSMRHYFIF